MNYDGRIARNGSADAGEQGFDTIVAHDDPSHADQYDPPRSKLRRNLLLATLVLLTVLSIWYAVHRYRAAHAATAPINQAPTVTVVIPGRTTVAGKINATGALAARHELDIGAVGDGGQVSQVLVEAGQWVHRGQLLALLDRQVQSAQALGGQANVAVAQADARLAQANLDRALKLVDRGFISRADIDRLTATRDGANARVGVARASVGEMGARIGRLDIRAPADGLLLDRAIEPGQVVGPGSGVLFRIAAGGQMELRARLSEADLARLRVGEPVRVTPTGSTQSFNGAIWQLAPMIDANSRQGTARIALAYAPQLRPGGFAEAEIISGAVNAPLLPESALQADGQGSYVFVVGKDNKAVRRTVTLGTLTDQGVAIIAGLNGNERVVARAGAFLAPGQTVNPQVAAPGAV